MTRPKNAQPWRAVGNPAPALDSIIEIIASGERAKVVGFDFARDQAKIVLTNGVRISLDYADLIEVER